MSSISAPIIKKLNEINKYNVEFILDVDTQKIYFLFHAFRPVNHIQYTRDGKSNPSRSLDVSCYIFSERVAHLKNHGYNTKWTKANFGCDFMNTELLANITHHLSANRHTEREKKNHT